MRGFAFREIVGLGIINPPALADLRDEFDNYIVEPQPLIFNRAELVDIKRMLFADLRDQCTHEYMKETKQLELFEPTQDEAENILVLGRHRLIQKLHEASEQLVEANMKIFDVYIEAMTFAPELIAADVFDQPMDDLAKGTSKIAQIYREQSKKLREKLSK